MRRPWPALVLLLGGLLMLVALYLPWLRFSEELSDYFGRDSGTAEHLLRLFSDDDSREGWSSAVAPAAALSALVLVAVSAAALVRPELASRLPLGRCTLIAAYFAVAVAVDLRSDARFFIGQDDLDSAVDEHFAYGAYLALTAVALMLVAAAFMRRGELIGDRSLHGMVATILAVGLASAFLLPAERFAGMSAVGIDSAVAQLAAAAALFAPGVWWRGAPDRRMDRIWLALATGIFTVAAFATIRFPAGRAYGAWLGLALATALVALSLASGGRVPDISRVRWRPLVMFAASAFLIGGLFLPATEICYPGGTFGPSQPERCESLVGWSSTVGAGVGALAMAMVGLALARIRYRPSRLEVACGIGLLVITLGFQFHYGPPGLRYGFWICAACAAALLVLALVDLGRPRIQVDARVVPVALCLAYLAVVVPTWWGTLVYGNPEFFFAPLSWLTITGALLAITLVGLWLQPSRTVGGLVLLPAALAALATVELARFEEITWGGGIVLALCALLALLAWVEHVRGLGELHVPEFLRVDRL